MSLYSWSRGGLVNAQTSVYPLSVRTPGGLQCHHSGFLIQAPRVLDEDMAEGLESNSGLLQAEKPQEVTLL